MYEFKFPDIGEGLIEGLLVKWTVNVGDSISKDQTVAQVGTDKAVVDLPSPVSGKVAKLLYKNGDTMPVGKVIMHIDNDSSSQISATTSSTAAQISSQSTPVVSQTSISQLSQSPIPEHITPISSRSKDVLATPQVRQFAIEHHVDLATVKPTGAHGEITMQDIMSGAHEQIDAHVEHQAQQSSHVHEVLATPSVRKLARELDVDINSITGTGDHGHITSDDVKRAVSQPTASQATSKSKSATVTPNVTAATPKIIQPLTSTDISGLVEEIPFTRVRQLIAQRMVTSRHTVAHVTMTDDANVTKLVALREKYKEIAAKQNIKLTYLPFVVKALVATLKKHPIFNSTLDQENQKVILKKYYNIGFAADTPEGLFVPVIANADRFSIYEIAQKISDLAQRAKEKKLAPSEITDGTCTISSVGILGVESFTPIVNYPQVAILGVGRIEDRAEVMSGEIKIQKMVTLSFSFDHRIADGADAARFMQTFISYLQDPELLLMEVA